MAMDAMSRALDMAFGTALLLTGEMRTAEAAVIDGIGCCEDLSPRGLLIETVRFAVQQGTIMANAPCEVGRFPLMIGKESEPSVWQDRRGASHVADIWPRSVPRSRILSSEVRPGSLIFPNSRLIGHEPERVFPLVAGEHSASCQRGPATIAPTTPRISANNVAI